MNNYITKFHVGQRVKIKEGFFKGRIGKVIDYSAHSTVGLNTDCYDRKITYEGGIYTVTVGFFKTVTALERSLEGV